MMTFIRFIHLAVALVLISNFSLRRASAIPMVFGIDNSRSQIAISGTVAGSPFSAQGPGALTTSYNGAINADLTGSTIQFTGGSNIDAETNGVWQPAAGGGAGSAPADYGVTNSVNLGIGAPDYFPGNAALRNMMLDLTSSVLALTNGGFAGNSLVFAFVTNTTSFDYSYGDFEEGSADLTGDSTNMIADGAILSTNDGVRTMTLQINSQFQFMLITVNDSIINLTGKLVATNAAPLPPPVILSIAKNDQYAIVTTENATAESSLLSSTNLAAWSPTSATITTNGAGMIVFTTLIRSPQAFYRVQQ